MVCAGPNRHRHGKHLSTARLEQRSLSFDPRQLSSKFPPNNKPLIYSGQSKFLYDIRREDGRRSEEAKQRGVDEWPRVLQRPTQASRLGCCQVNRALQRTSDYVGRKGSANCRSYRGVADHWHRLFLLDLFFLCLACALDLGRGSSSSSSSNSTGERWRRWRCGALNLN